MRLTNECQAHAHAQCNHVISASIGATPQRVYCECPCHEALLLRIQNALMRESLKNLKTTQE